MTRTPGVIACVPRSFPLLASARTAGEVDPDNVPPGFDLGSLAHMADDEKLAVDIHRYWGRDGGHLTVKFLDTRDSELKARILSHLNAWSTCAKVSFVESDTEPLVRIARWTAADSREHCGYWSYVGTDLKLVKDASRPTMNLEAFTMATEESEYRRVVRHEAGHALGFPHEHMRAAIIGRLDREAVIREFMRTQGWSRAEVIAQVLTSLEDSNLYGTRADETSIMCYHVAGELTLDGVPVAGGLDITPSDCRFAASIYGAPQFRR